MKKIICGMVAFMLIISVVFGTDCSVQAASTPELSKSVVTLAKGDSVRLRVFGVSNEAQESAEWKSSDTKVATVTQRGQVKAKAVGDANITVVIAGKKRICKVIVESYATNVITLVNEERTSHGLDKLKTDVQLSKAAQARAEELYKSGELEYDRPNGSKLYTILDDYSIDKYYNVDQNLAKGQKSPSEVMKAWMSIEGKRASILRPENTHIGVGYSHGYWVQLFIKK